MISATNIGGPATEPVPPDAHVSADARTPVDGEGGAPRVAPHDEAVEARIRAFGEELWDRARGQVPGIFDRGFWYGRALDRAMRDPAFKVNLFRFVDVLPVLGDAEQVAAHVREYLLGDGPGLPEWMGAALRIASARGGSGGRLLSGIAAWAIRRNVAEMAKRFIVGRNAMSSLPVLRKLHDDGIAFTIDLLGEKTISYVEADTCRARYLDLIEHLPDAVVTWSGDGAGDRSGAEAIPRTNVSMKLSAMDPHLDPVDLAGGVARLMDRALPLFLRARETGVFINLDMEEWDLHGITYDFFERVATHRALRDWPHLGIVVQAYLKSAASDVERLLALARSRGTPLTVRLVKGAYWDHEIVRSRQHGYPCPVLTDKAATDASFERLTLMLLDHADMLHPAFGSHNLRSIAHAVVQARERGIPEDAYEIQMLYGMAEPERAALRSMGHRVRLYTPAGDLLPGMAYLVRRLLENTSNAGFLRLSYHESEDVRHLLARPAPHTPPPSAEGVAFDATTRGQDAATAQERLARPFENCPLTDFTDGVVRTRFAEAMAAVGRRLPIVVPVAVAGEEYAPTDSTDRRTLERHCPCELDRVAAHVTLATASDAEGAVAAAMRAWPAWRDRPLLERATLLEALADRLETDRHELAALETWEVGKPWREADADVAEAMDYCRYYARQALVELAPRRLGDVPGERNILSYEGRGPAVVIAPWNFPLAILCSMTTAALVAGDTAIMKPAEQSNGLAHALYNRMRQVGFPADVVQLVPGIGETIGAFLVEHPLVAQIAFTGSKAVGLSILANAAKTKPGQPQVKRVVCEMGGKNAIIVDDDADLDEAVVGVMASAFGYAGQKCSACSRAIVVGAAYEPFAARLVEACRSMIIGPAHRPECQMPAVVDREAYERLRALVLSPGEGAEPLYIGRDPDETLPNGLYVPPAIFLVSDRRHPLMQVEHFGPVLALMRASSFDEALETAVAAEYALTGGLYSRSPTHLAEAARRFCVGNLYLNRGCTGAVVGRQPFGGFGMSGAGTKAGGPGYLLNFTEPRCVTENTMRHGFAPDVSI